MTETDVKTHAPDYPSLPMTGSNGIPPRSGDGSAKKTSVCLAICLAVVLAWFSPWWAGGRNLAPLDLANEMMQPWRGAGEPGIAKNHFVSDSIDVVLGYHMVAADSYRKEGWLGWSDLTYGGTAQYANTMALYDDWAMQLHRWFDFWTAWHLGLIGQVLLAAFGMVLLLRGRGANVVWSSCGALAFAANSQFVTWINHRFALGPFCWVPWILWAIDCHRRGRRWAWGLVPIFISLAFLGGTLQHAAMVALAVAASWGEEAWLAWRGRAHLRRQAGLFGRYAVWGILGAGISGLMLVPCTDALMTSNKLGLHFGLFAHAENGIYPQGILQPLFNLAAYPLQVFPSALGRCDSMDLLKLFKSELFFVAYIGTLPTLIAFLAIGRKETGALERLLILIGLVLPLTPAVRFLYQRLLLLFLLGGAMAFVAFMGQSADLTRRKLCKITAWVSGSMAALWLAGSVALSLFGKNFLIALHQRILTAASGSSFAGCRKWLETRAENFTGDLFIWSPQQAVPLLLLAMALWGLGWTASRFKSRRNTGSILLATAIVLEVTMFAARWVVWADPAKYPLFPETPEVAALRANVGRDGRVTTMNHLTEHLSRTPFVPNTLEAYGIASITGYDSVVPNGMVMPNNIPVDADKLGRFGVSHLITWAGNPDVPPGWNIIWSSPVMDLYSNSLALPRYVAFRTDGERDGFLNGAERNFLPVHETTGKQNTRHLEIPSEARWVRVAENEDDGWEYRCDDHSDWEPVLRARDASMLMEIHHPGETTEIEMRYNPPLRRLGYRMTGTSLFLLAAGSVWMFRRKPQTAISNS
ncbi:MAG: hypothetical protein ABIS50_23160 [Luteolibacter sp.]|uniref:hypothetical protein n=1 Tax=Luteolibacter sp. TaxID=1962973 RepID=UPI003263F5FA